MAHGYPDYGLYTPKKTVHALQDMAELAVRLGSIVTFDRRGDVFFLDGFEDGIEKWVITKGIGTEVFENTSAYSRSGGFSALIGTVANIGSYIWVQHYHSFPRLSKFGFEISLSMDSTYDALIELGIAINSEPTYYRWGIRYKPDTDEWLVWDGVAGWTVFTTLPIYKNLRAFNTVKYIADAINAKYTYVLINEKSFDLSAYSPSSGSYTGVSTFDARIMINNTTANARDLYIDDVIITQNEP